jgi:hypothetical protein
LRLQFADAFGGESIALCLDSRWQYIIPARSGQV